MKLVKNVVVPQAIVLTAFLFAVSTGVNAQSEFSGALEEITVTAQKRPQSLQDVSISVNVVSGDKLFEAGITKVEDLQAYVPNLTMSETGIGTNIYIRGIGSGINQGFEQSVGLYTDGVYSGRAQLSRAPFLDLARVEVLRGPQNILYGKNSIGGALSLVTAEPTDEFEGMVSVSLEPEYDENVVDFVLSGPISENLSGRLAHRTRQTDGYIDSAAGGNEPERDEQSTRVTFAWDAGGNLDATLKYEQSTFDVIGRQVELVGFEPSLNPNLGGANWGQFLLSLNPLTAITPAAPTPLSVLDAELDFTRDSNGDFSNNDTETLALTLNYAWGDYTLTSTTANLSYDYEELCDCDFTSANLFFVQSEEDYEQYSQEFRITSPVGETIDWIAGFYYQKSELDFNDSFFATEDSALGNILDSVLPFLFIPEGEDPTDLSASAYVDGAGQQLNGIDVPRTFIQDSELWSAFVQATWNINDQARLTLGGRYSDEEKEAIRQLDYADSNGEILPFNDTFIPNTELGVDYILGAVLQVERHDLAGERNESNFAPLINFEYDLADDVMAYATWSRGFKSGGYDARSNTAPYATGADGAPIVTVIENAVSDALDVTIPEGSFEFDEEQAETIELGLKSRFYDNKVELNVAAFFTEYEDLQVSQFDGVLSFNVGNAAEAETKGVEIDGRWAISDHLTLGGALAWLDFEFKDYEGGQCTQQERIIADLNGLPTPVCDYEGFSNQYVADFSGAISLDYYNEISDGLLFRGTLDTIFTTDYNPSQNVDPGIEQDGYTKLNLRLALSDYDERWEVALLGKNITDEEIITYANDVPLSANLSQTVGYYAFVESPRTVAIQGTFRF